jgi:hypothetical protein
MLLCHKTTDGPTPCLTVDSSTVQQIRHELAYLMFCWLCIIVYQYCETNMMHCVYSLLRIKGLCMFWALLDRPQEALHKRHLVYCMCVMSVGCTRIEVERTQYTKCCLCRTSWGGWASNTRNMWSPLILDKLNINFITLVSLYWWIGMFVCFTSRLFSCLNSTMIWYFNNK